MDPLGGSYAGGKVMVLLFKWIVVLVTEGFVVRF